LDKSDKDAPRTRNNLMRDRIEDPQSSSIEDEIEKVDGEKRRRKIAGAKRERKTERIE
jgi:hypothetical protein